MSPSDSYIFVVKQEWPGTRDAVHIFEWSELYASSRSNHAYNKIGPQKHWQTMLCRRCLSPPNATTPLHRGRLTKERWKASATLSISSLSRPQYLHLRPTKDAYPSFCGILCWKGVVSPPVLHVTFCSPQQRSTYFVIRELPMNLKCSSAD